MERRISEFEASMRSGLSMASLQKSRSIFYKTGILKGPVFKQVGNRIFYKLSDVQNYMEREEAFNAKRFEKIAKKRLSKAL